MKKLFKWKVVITLQIGTEVSTIVTADSIRKACAAMMYTAEKLNGEITKIERDDQVESDRLQEDQ